MAHVQYIIWQFESGEETHTPHFQGYVQLKVKERPTMINRVWPGAHLVVARGSPEQNREYCTKSRTRVAGPWERGTIGPGAGDRTDLKALGAAIMAGKKVSEVAEDKPEAVIHYARGLKALEEIASRKAAESETRDPYTYVLWGDTGTGKTSLAHAFFGESSIYTHHLVPGGHQWFDGYDGQPALIIDDFTGWVPFRTLLLWLDRYPCRLEVKGGFTYARWRHVFITSNKPPEQWYTDESCLAPLARRVSYVWHFPEDIDIARQVLTGLIGDPINS